MKTVILAEKSSQAAAYAGSFQKKTTVAGNYMIQDPLFDGETVIVHASGHLLGLLQPDEYDPKWKKWNLDNLPIFPEQYKYKIQYGKGKQMANIKQQLKEADRIIIATDSDREGENIARSIIRHAGAEKKEMKRLWINSLGVQRDPPRFCGTAGWQRYLSILHRGPEPGNSGLARGDEPEPSLYDCAAESGHQRRRLFRGQGADADLVHDL